jgi:hypothetical protein
VDFDKSGMLKGAAAVPFLSRSGLDRPILKQVRLLSVVIFSSGVSHAYLFDVVVGSLTVGYVLSRDPLSRGPDDSCSPITTLPLPLSQDWNLSNKRGDTALNREEFYVAMYLVCAMCCPFTCQQPPQQRRTHPLIVWPHGCMPRRAPH